MRDEDTASSGHGEGARTARQAVYENLPPDEKMLFLDILTREMEETGDADAAWDAAWRAVEDPFIHGVSDPRRAGYEMRDPDFGEIRKRRRFDLEWHVRRARDAGLDLVEALRHAEEEIRDPSRREADPLAQVEAPDEAFLGERRSTR